MLYLNKLWGYLNMNKFDTKCMPELIMAKMGGGKTSYIKNNDNNYIKKLKF